MAYYCASSVGPFLGSSVIFFPAQSGRNNASIVIPLLTNCASLSSLPSGVYNVLDMRQLTPPYCSRLNTIGDSSCGLGRVKHFPPESMSQTLRWIRWVVEHAFPSM